MLKDCPFCTISDAQDSERIIFESPYFFSIWDGFPVSKGHALLISKQHLASFFDLSIEQREDAMTALEKLKAHIHAEYAPDGFNIGINDGPAAGQTVPHLHIHLIPRYVGDINDPRGGIRWVLPAKAEYWSK